MANIGLWGFLMMKLVLLALLTATEALAAPPRDQDVGPTKLKLVVMPFDHTAGVDEQLARALAERVLVAIRATGRYQEMGISDFQTMLGMASFQQAVGCDDTNCLAEIAGAAGVELLVTGNVVGEENSYSILAKLIDTHAAAVRSRVQINVARDQLLDAADPLVNDLFRLKPPDIWGLTGIGAGSLGVAALATGGVFAVLASNSAKKGRNTTQPGSQLAAERTLVQQRVANISFVAGAVLAAAGASVYFLSRPSKAKATTGLEVGQLLLSPTPSGVFVTWAGGF